MHVTCISRTDASRRKRTFPSFDVILPHLSAIAAAAPSPQYGTTCKPQTGQATNNTALLQYFTPRFHKNSFINFTTVHAVTPVHIQHPTLKMQSKSFLATFILLLSTILSCTSFSPNLTPPCRRQQATVLKLHPDQASELEAAASEILQAAENVDSKDLVDDTKVMGMRTPLSVAAAQSSQQPSSRSWWSKTFVKFISRGN